MVAANKITSENVKSLFPLGNPRPASDLSGNFMEIPVNGENIIITPSASIYCRNDIKKNGRSFTSRSFVVPSLNKQSADSKKGLEILRAYLSQAAIRYKDGLEDYTHDFNTHKTDELDGLVFYKKVDGISDFTGGAMSVSLKQGLNDNTGETWHTTISDGSGKTLPSDRSLDSFFSGKTFNISHVVYVKGIKIPDDKTKTAKIMFATKNCIITSLAESAGLDDYKKMIEEMKEEGVELGKIFDFGSEGAEVEQLDESFFESKSKKVTKKPKKVVKRSKPVKKKRAPPTPEPSTSEEDEESESEDTTEELTDPEPEPVKKSKSTKSTKSRSKAKKATK